MIRRAEVNNGCLLVQQVVVVQALLALGLSASSRLFTFPELGLVALVVVRTWHTIFVAIVGVDHVAPDPVVAIRVSVVPVLHPGVLDLLALHVSLVLAVRLVHHIGSPVEENIRRNELFRSAQDIVDLIAGGLSDTLQLKPVLKLGTEIVVQLGFAELVRHLMPPLGLCLELTSSSKQLLIIL